MIERNNLSRLTLVMPTYERQDFALRLMNYWAGKGPHLIVIDGSAKPIEPTKLDIFDSHIQYLHRPVGLYQRLLEALHLVGTEFVALAGDDEFYVPSAVNQCIKELDNDKGLVACCGLVLGYGIKNRSIYGKNKYGNLFGYSIDSENALNRVKHHMSNYLPSLVYAISRTEVWKISWRNILTKEFPFFASAEIQLELCMSYAGRSKVIRQLMWMRAHNINKPIRGTDPSLDRGTRINHWWEDKKNKAQHAEFITIMSATFKQLIPYETDYTKSNVMAGIKEYIKLCKRDARGKFLQNIISKLKIIKFIFPNNKKKHETSDHEFDAIMTTAQKLEARGATIDYDALFEITDLVTLNNLRKF